ncbi:uncharacterized protein J7T54_002918 [Emericellopsis cladophorae]|uniref:Uncharacterized protein n=1 Tax=Emericellopsis cladophorae TaxID=2686198 RepID=A0A9P9XWD7_9HYPO|nr:uncharacterized protein J7T54_002918 [Emericellopsis cladophorae]KAI6778650.1 hypothetical protein J7T54_002918 [Emericellopsis cladophorae]
MLGRVVANFRQPLVDFRPTNASEHHITDPSITPWGGNQFAQRAKNAGSFKLHVLKLLNLSVDGDMELSRTFASKKVTVYELQMQEDVYKNLLKDPQTKDWIIKKCSQLERLYMITTVLVWSDAEITESSAHNAAQSGQVEVPVGAAAPIPISGAHVKASAGRVKEESQESTRCSVGEHVFAVGYKIIRKRLRDIGRGAVPIYKDRQPTYAADRRLGTEETQQKNDQEPAEIEEELPHLDMKGEWAEGVLDDEVEIKADGGSFWLQGCGSIN